MGVVLPFLPRNREEMDNPLLAAKQDYKDLLAATHLRLQEVAEHLKMMSNRVISLSHGLKDGERSWNSVTQITDELVNLTSQLWIGSLIDAASKMRMLEERIKLLSQEGKE